MLKKIRQLFNRFGSNNKCDAAPPSPPSKLDRAVGMVLGGYIDVPPSKTMSLEDYAEWLHLTPWSLRISEVSTQWQAEDEQWLYLDSLMHLAGIEIRLKEDDENYTRFCKDITVIGCGVIMLELNGNKLIGFIVPRQPHYNKSGQSVHPVADWENGFDIEKLKDLSQRVQSKNRK